MSETFVSRVMRDGGDLVYFISARNKGLWAWYYVRIDKLKHELFKRVNTSGRFDIADYGTVLACGYGEHPPEAVRMEYEGEDA